MDPNAFDTLMKRHAEGDRDPDLISELDRMAWSAFHDPWELSGPLPSAAPVPERMVLESGHYDPEQPEKLELATLDLFVSLRGRSFLKRTAWPFLVTYDYLADPSLQAAPGSSWSGRMPSTSTAGCSGTWTVTSPTSPRSWPCANAGMNPGPGPRPCP